MRLAVKRIEQKTAGNRSRVGLQYYLKAYGKLTIERMLQDAVFELKRDSLTIVQAVPAGKLYLFPNPALKVGAGQPAHVLCLPCAPPQL